MNSLKTFWHKLARNGLRADEGVYGHREVMLLNKIIVVSELVLVVMLPVEILVNGFKLVPLELTFMAMMLVPFILQRYRLFWPAKLFAFVCGNAFIVAAGTMVGEGVDNHVAILPLLLFGILLFRSARDMIIAFLLSLGFYFTLKYLHQNIEPVFLVEDDVKSLFSILFFVMSALLTFFLGYYFLSMNNDYENLIIEQKENIRQKNQEIIDSITYAKRIQQAKLPPMEEFSSLLPESFILFRPKDIVSGDFYYFARKEGMVFIAAADCTGHGVPGALMSMIGSEKLNEAIMHSGDVSEILKLLNRGLRASLRQTLSNESTRDGMDIALCSIGPGNSVDYAGANRPLWLIRAKGTTVEEIKPTKKAIGGLTGDEQEFAKSSFILDEGDTFYIFTDGYADQFNGSAGKKLMSARFREMLLEMREKTMKEQEQYLGRFITEWKSDAEQVDDILIIGVRIPS